MIKGLDQEGRPMKVSPRLQNAMKTRLVKRSRRELCLVNR